MTGPSVVVEVPREQLEFLNELLKKNTRVDDQPKDVIETITADFGDDIQADIKVCNGGGDAGPYVDAVLFDGGSEVTVISETSDQLDGEYIFDYRGTEYRVEVIQKKHNLYRLRVFETGIAEYDVFAESITDAVEQVFGGHGTLVDDSPEYVEIAGEHSNPVTLEDGAVVRFGGVSSVEQIPLPGGPVDAVPEKTVPEKSDTGLFSGGPMRELTPGEERCIDAMLPCPNHEPGIVCDCLYCSNGHTEGAILSVDVSSLAPTSWIRLRTMMYDLLMREARRCAASMLEMDNGSEAYADMQRWGDAAMKVVHDLAIVTRSLRENKDGTS